MQPKNLYATAAVLAAALATPAFASSHLDAPSIILDDPANTTDVYAFVSAGGGTPYLSTALAVYPFQEPGTGPNSYRFDDRVLYEIHVALDGNVARGKADISYQFRFDTKFANSNTILQAYLGVVQPAGVGSFPANQNLRQSYTLTMVDHRKGAKTVLGAGPSDGLTVPPNNQGLLTPFYNQGDNGDKPAKEGVAKEADLDPYTRNAIAELPRGYRGFAGQRDDGFYADIHSIFDLDFSFGRNTGTPTKPYDGQGGFNVHTIALNIPLAELGGAKIAGVYATTSRMAAKGGDDDDDRDDDRDFVQVARQGNPLFVEGLVALKDKDRYLRSKPTGDVRFAKYADDPEISRVLGVTPIIPGLIRSIFIPDLIKVDLTTGPARLAGEDGFHRLGVFGGDVLKSLVQDPFGNGGFIPGGWPNGRRFGDDVTDIAIIALGAAGPGPDFSKVDADRVTKNDITYNDVFPYAATPLNGRNHGHHDGGSE